MKEINNNMSKNVIGIILAIILFNSSCKNSVNDMNNTASMYQISSSAPELEKSSPPDTRELTKQYLRGVWIHQVEGKNLFDTLIFADIPRIYYSEDEKDALLNGNPSVSTARIAGSAEPPKIGSVKLFQSSIKIYYEGENEMNCIFSEPDDYMEIGVNDVTFLDKKSSNNMQLKFTNHDRLVLNGNSVFVRAAEDWNYKKKIEWKNVE